MGLLSENLVKLGFNMINAALFIDNSNFYHALKDSGKLPFCPCRL
jgi:hypothetical protein